jgi:hypothetical protein
MRYPNNDLQLPYLTLIGRTLLPPGDRAGRRPGAVLSREQPLERSWIGARHVK